MRMCKWTSVMRTLEVLMFYCEEVENDVEKNRPFRGEIVRIQALAYLICGIKIVFLCTKLHPGVCYCFR